MNHIGTQKIETERIILRKIKISDAEDMFYNWANDCEVTKYVTWTPHESVEDTEGVIDFWLIDIDDIDVYRWCIVWKENAQVIGTIDVVNLSEKLETAEIGYCLSRRYWGQGVMTEALQAVIDYLFSRVGLNRIIARHNTYNPASGRVMEKSGMIFEGVQRQAGKDNKGNYCDLAYYSILKEEWQERH